MVNYEHKKLKEQLDNLQIVDFYLNKQKEFMLTDAINFASSKGLQEIEFNNPVSSCIYSIDEDLMDCNIIKIKFDSSFPVTECKVTIEACYVGAQYDVNLSDLIYYDKLDLSECILNNCK